MHTHTCTRKYTHRLSRLSWDGIEGRRNVDSDGGGSIRTPCGNTSAGLTVPKVCVFLNLCMCLRVCVRVCLDCDFVTKCAHAC